MGKKRLKTAACFQLFLHVTVRVAKPHLNSPLPQAHRITKICSIHTYHKKIKH